MNIVKLYRNILKMLTLTLLTIFLLVGLYYFPFFPAALLDNGDPSSVEHEAVTAAISNSDLEEILYLVRGGTFVSAHEYISLWLTYDVLSIANSRESRSHTLSGSTSEITVNPPIGKVVVSVGYICGTLCGSGATIYLDTVDGEWVIVDTSLWIS